MLNESISLPAATPQELESTTYRIEKWRAVPMGVLETATGTFLLLIAVQAYQAGATDKAMIAAGANVGLLLTPFVVQAVERRRIRISHGAAAIAALGTVAFFIAALFPTLSVYVLAAVFGAACLSALTPLVIQVYQDNYPAAQRGHLFSRTTVIRVAAAAAFAELAGRLLTTNIELFRWLLVSVCGGVCACRPAAPAYPVAAAHATREPQSHAWAALSAGRSRLSHDDDGMDADGLRQPDDDTAAHRIPCQP